MSSSLTLTTDEFNLLSQLVGSQQAQSLGPSARASALESLRSRRIVRSDGKVDVRIALMFAVLARPTSRVTVTRFGSDTPSIIIAHARLIDVLVDIRGGQRVLTPHVDGIGFALGSIEAGRGEGFSVAGGTWRDLVLQAPHATTDQLSRLAQLDGATVAVSDLAARVAQAHTSRHDAQVLTYRGRRRWLGLELSWVDWGEGSWLIDDGGRFGRSEDLDARRAVVTPGSPETGVRELIRRVAVD
ncbi:MAG: hypothetical protein ACKOI2_04165 [Actinomycetota bacterium]